jgi:hypothetical protein
MTRFSKADKIAKEALKEKKGSLNASESLESSIPFIKDGMDKDAIIEALWEAYVNHGSESDPKNYNFVKHILNEDPKSETDEDYYKLNSVANDAFVSTINELNPKALDKESFIAFVNREGMLDKLKAITAINMNEDMHNIDRFKSKAEDLSSWYTADGILDQEKVRNNLFKDYIAANKVAQEQAAQQEALEQQNQENYTPDPSGDTGASLGTGFGSIGAPYEVQPLRQSPVWLTRDQEKSVADFIASRALQEYKK